MQRALLLLSFSLLLLKADAAFAQTTSVWNIQLPRDFRAVSNVDVENHCQTRHTFEIIKSAEMTWLEFTGSNQVSVAPREHKAVPVRIDTTGLEEDSYDAELLVKCVDCGTEPTCLAKTLPVRLKVVWTAQQINRFRPDQMIQNQILVLLNQDSSNAINRLVAELEAQYQLRRLKIFELRSISRVGVLFLVLNPQIALSVTLTTIQADPRVLLVQPNFVYQTTIADYKDPQAALQYGARQINAEAAHKYATGKGVKVAVLDTGIDAKHADLKGRVIETRNFVDGDDEFAQDAHGTLIAGIIAAVANNGIGIYGIAPDAKLLAIKVCKPKSKTAVAADGTSTTLAQGLDFALSNGAQIINLSLGGPQDATISKLVKKAFAQGICVVAAAGNEGAQGQALYPAAMEKVIAVSAINSRNELYEMSSRGDFIDLAAPGVEIISTTPGNRFNTATGTSMAAPHVTGVVALVLQMKPTLKPGEIKTLLEAAAKDLGAPGKDALFGSGCVDALKALQRLPGER